MKRKIPEILVGYEDYMMIIQEKSPNTVYSYLTDLMLLLDYLKTKEKYHGLKMDEHLEKRAF